MGWIWNTVKSFAVDTAFNSEAANTNKVLAASESYDMKNAAAIFGMPYQFMPHVDLRLLDTEIKSNQDLANKSLSDLAVEGSDLLGSLSSVGATYADKIYSKIPILMLTPGKANFLSDSSKESRQKAILSIITGDNKTFADVANNTSTRYYDFEADTAEYFKYVNSMCRVAAIYLGIGDTSMIYSYNDKGEADSALLKDFDWSRFNGYSYSFNSGKGLIDLISSTLDNSPDYISFYIDAQDSINDSFSNSTSQSSLASTINGASASAKELAFLAGYGSSAIGGFVDNFAENIETITKQLMDDLENLGQDGGVINNIANHLTTIAQGGRMIFPDIWSDSSYGKSYSVTVKLISPDHDKLSVYMNIVVPIIHALALVLPRSANGNPNTYFEPFLVRALYKGNFSIDTGIITDLSVKRGGSDTWSLDGIPCEAELSIGIKDLYQAISMSKTETAINSQSAILTNTNLMDFLGNMCGVDIFTPNVSRNLEIYKLTYLNFGTNIKDYITLGIFGNMHDKLQNTILEQCKKFMF